MADVAGDAEQARHAGDDQAGRDPLRLAGAERRGGEAGEGVGQELPAPAGDQALNRLRRLAAGDGAVGEREAEPADDDVGRADAVGGAVPAGAGHGDRLVDCMPARTTPI